MKAYHRKKSYFIIVTVLLSMLVAAASACKPATEGTPIKVGLMMPYTGDLATASRFLTQGMEMAFEEVNWKAAGSEIKLIKEDTERKPDLAMQKVRKLVESDRVNFVTGMTATESIATRDYLDSQGVPTILSYTSDQLLGRLGSKYIYVASLLTGQQDAAILGDYAAKKLGKRKAFLIAGDFSAGHDEAEWFKRAFERAGGTVVGDLYPPLVTPDFGPYLPKIDPQKTDVVFAFWPAGATAARFVKQYHEFGLRDKVQLTGVSIINFTLLPEIGEPALGVYSNLQYTRSIDSPQNRKFVQAYEKKYGGKVDDFAEIGYVIARIVIESVETVKGDLQNKDKVLEAIGNIKLEAPRGPFKFASNRGPLQNMYVYKAVKGPEGMDLAIVDTYPAVAPGWLK